MTSNFLKQIFLKLIGIFAKTRVFTLYYVMHHTQNSLMTSTANLDKYGSVSVRP